MKRFLYLILFLLIGSSTSFAQDWAVCASDGAANEGFAMFALRNIPASAIYYITEDDYNNGTGEFDGSEGIIQYTTPGGGISEGVVVSIRETSTNSYTVTGGGGTATHVASSGSWILSNCDEIYIFESSDAVTPGDDITNMHHFHYSCPGAPLATQDPTGDWPMCWDVVSIGTGANGSFEYNASRVNTTRAMMEAVGNWTTTSGTTDPFDLTAFTSQMLPVELASFKAKKRNNTVSLDWVTASEINNDYFEIQRSENGSDFETIGMVHGNGTIDYYFYYSFIDEKPFDELNYYRLKQVDYDGNFEYSDIEVVDFKVENPNFTISPNPFDNEVTINLEYSYSRDTEVRVFNNLGQLVITTVLAKDQDQKTLNLGELNSGMYFLEIGEGPNAIKEKITKF